MGLWDCNFQAHEAPGWVDKIVGDGRALAGGGEGAENGSEDVHGGEFDSGAAIHGCVLGDRVVFPGCHSPCKSMVLI